MIHDRIGFQAVGRPFKLGEKKNFNISFFFPCPFLVGVSTLAEQNDFKIFYKQLACIYQKCVL